MTKTTIYLPDELKMAVGKEAARRNTSEAEVIREAIRVLVQSSERPKPRGGLFSGGQQIAEHVDEYLMGFGQ